MGRTGQRVGLAATLLALALSTPPALAEGVPPAKASKEQAELAQKSFLAGDEHYDAKRYEEALKLFRESYDVVASPNSRLMIARSLRELGRFDEAFPEFEAAVEVAKAAAAAEDKYAQTQKAAEDELRQLTARIGRLQIKLLGASTDAKVTVAGKSYDAAALERPLVVAPGNVSVSAIGTDGREVRMEVAVGAGST